jgi:hypothetical protein
MDDQTKYEKLYDWMNKNGKKWIIRNTVIFIVILIIEKIFFFIDGNATPLSITF